MNDDDEMMYFIQGLLELQDGQLFLMVFLAEADFWSDFLGTKFSNFGILFFSNVFSWKSTCIFWKKNCVPCPCPAQDQYLSGQV